MLDVTDIDTYYSDAHILHDVSFSAETDEVVGMIGRNGVGKTTTLRSVMGLTPPRSGTVRFEGTDITGENPSTIANLGIGYVPQERGMFPELTVVENLKMGVGTGDFDRARMDDILDRFPQLKNRLQQKAGTLSGGEQQMVATARALMRDPKLLLVDEPTEGLMPSLIPEIADIIRDIAASGYTIVLVEQNVDLVLDLSDRVYLMDKGRIGKEATPEQLENRPQLLDEYLAVS